MAVPPNVLKNNLNDELNIFEQKIDEKLRLQKLYGSDVTITPPDGMNYAHYQAIRDRYIQAGWKNVTWRDDQRDGAYMTFSMNTPHSSNVGGWWDR
jgi:hypothetical protein